MNTRLKDLRSSLGLSSEAFGAPLGVTRSAISNIETGKRNLTEQMIRAIVREYNVNEEWLRTGEGEMFLTPPESELDALARRYNLSRRDKAVVERFVSLNQMERNVIMDFLVDVAGSCSSAESIQAEPSVEEMVEAYREELIRERASGGKSGVSRAGGSSMDADAG